MARIPLMELADMTPEMAEIVTQVGEMTGEPTGMRAVVHRPDIITKFVPFYWSLQTEGLLDRKLIELVRLAIAQINQCANCLGSRYQDSIDQGLTEDMVAALPSAETSPLFTEREKAAIAFGQKMAFDHFSVGDAEFERLYRSFSVKEVVELGLDVAMFVGLGRLFAVIDAKNVHCSIPIREAADVAS